MIWGRERTIKRKRGREKRKMEHISEEKLALNIKFMLSTQAIFITRVLDPRIATVL